MRFTLCINIVFIGLAFADDPKTNRPPVVKPSPVELAAREFHRTNKPVTLEDFHRQRAKRMTNKVDGVLKK